MLFSIQAYGIELSFFYLVLILLQCDLSLHGIDVLNYIQTCLCGQYLLHFLWILWVYLLFESMKFYVCCLSSMILLHIFGLLDLSLSEVRVLKSPITIFDLFIFSPQSY